MLAEASTSPIFGLAWVMGLWQAEAFVLTDPASVRVERRVAMYKR